MTIPEDSMETEDVPEGCVLVDTRPRTAGNTYCVRGMEYAGLLAGDGVSAAATNHYYLRGNTLDLFPKLNNSTLLQGPPGSGKSTLVWFWLLRMVANKKEAAVWFHFQKIDSGIDCVLIESTEQDNVVSILKIVEEDPFKYVKDNYSQVVKHCVVDGVREDNLSKASGSWTVFGKMPSRLKFSVHMVWVSSQQVVIPGQELQARATAEVSFLNWGLADVQAHVHTMCEAEKEVFRADTQEALTVMGGGDLPTYHEAVLSKFWIFGGSARWMFGMKTKFALEDLRRYTGKIDDAEKLNAGLQGARSNLAVNHIIGQYSPGVFEPISKYVLELLAKTVGLKAILVMYNSPWVQANPSVHGFVFEWDIFVQIETTKTLQLVDNAERQSTWHVDQVVSLHDFLKNGVTSPRLIVRPEKWNYPEYDGLYITSDDGGNYHLVAWNASEAVTHKGNVNKLVVLLQHLSMRAENAVNFATVRFLFIVPRVSMVDFKLPSDAVTLQAKQVLACGTWGFERFEVAGTTPSSSV